MAERLGTQLQSGGLEQSIHTGLLGSGLFGGASLDLNFAVTKNVGPLVTFTRASNATYIDSAGTLQTTATDVPRFDHNPTTGESLGLLVEEQRTNSLSASEETVTAPWGLAAATGVANNGVAPDGTTTADKIISTGGGSFRSGAGVVNATAYTYSVFLKHVAGTGVISSVGFERFGSTVLAGNSSFDLLTGTIVSNGTNVQFSSITRYPNNWFRVSITATSTDVTTTIVNYAAASGNEFLVWGAQLEAGAFPTSYIPTTTAAATRSADVASITGANFSSWYRQDEGTVFAEYTGVIAGVNRGVWALTADSSNSNNIIDFFNGGLSPVLRVNSSGVNQAYISTGTATTATFNKVASAFAQNNFARSLNGLAADLDTSGTMPATTPILLNIGTINAYGVASLSGTIRRLTFFPQRLPNSTLQAITQ